MPLAKDASAVQNLGGGEVWVSETNAAGSTTATWEELPYVASTSFTDTTNVETTSDEAGRTFPTNSTREAMLEVVTMQKDKATLKWASHTAKGKYYHVLRKVNGPDTPIDGDNLWQFIPIATVDPVAAFSTPGTEGPTYTFRILHNEAAISAVNASTVDAGLSSISCAAGDQYDYIEVLDS